MRILREIPEVAVEPTTADGRQDIVLCAGDVTYIVEVKAQRATNAAAARQLVAYASERASGNHLIVVARTTTKEARQLLEEAGIGFLDGAGNMRVRLPGLFLWTEGRRKTPPTRAETGEPRVKLTGKAGVVAQALLVAPNRKWKVHHLADQSGVSTGLAHRVLARLEREGLVEAMGAGPQRTRQVTNPTALLDLWAEEMRDRGIQARQAFRLARDPRAQAGALGRLLAEAKVEHAISGAAGAALLAPFVTAIPVTDVWVTETAGLDEVLADVQAESVQGGHNVVLRQVVGDGPLAFRHEIDGVWIANPFRLYLDLRQDPRRGREQAERLRGEVIHF